MHRLSFERCLRVCCGLVGGSERAAHMSVPTLTNMATAPAMPPPAAFCAAFFKTSVNGFFSPSAACEPGASTHIQEEAASRRLRARTDGLMKTLCRVGPYTEPKPGNAMRVLDEHVLPRSVRLWRIRRFMATKDALVGASLDNQPTGNANGRFPVQRRTAPPSIKANPPLQQSDECTHPRYGRCYETNQCMSHSLWSRASRTHASQCSLENHPTNTR